MDANIRDLSQPGRRRLRHQWPLHHEQIHLADGLVTDHTIECPKPNGRFDYRTGQAKGAPVRINLKTYPAKVGAARF